MSQTSKFAYHEDKQQQETADDFYPQSKLQDKAKSSINALVVTLNSKKTQLRSNQIEQASIRQKMTELDVEVGKLMITNQYLSADADELATKGDELLFQKNELLKELKEWKEARQSLRSEVCKGQEEIREKRRYIDSLQETSEELKAKIKAKQAEKKEVYDYNMDMELAIEACDNQISKLREQRDCSAKTATTLDTFAKSFKKNIMVKEKELSRAKFDSSELENMIATKEFQKSNFAKEKEKVQWEGKMYEHHNQEIERTNEKLKADLEKLLNHLESLKKNNRNLSGCIKEYSETGLKTVKKILQLVNK